MCILGFVHLSIVAFSCSISPKSGQGEVASVKYTNFDLAQASEPPSVLPTRAPIIILDSIHTSDRLGMYTHKHAPGLSIYILQQQGTVGLRAVLWF